MTAVQAAVPSTAEATRTRLLQAGVLAGPLFVAAGLVQIPFRDGFDPTRHPFSFLLIGDAGWVQAGVFVVTGALYGIAGFGLRRAVGRRAGWCAQVAASGLGAGMIVAGLAAPQPAFGYPAGTPEGPPDSLTTASMLHGAGFGISVLSWMVLLITLGAVLARDGARRLRVAAYLTTIALPIVPAASRMPSGTVLLYVVVGGAFVVTSLLFARLAAIGEPVRLAAAAWNEPV